jgi:hypothetical protein
MRAIIPVQNVRLRAGLGRRSGQTWKYDPQGPQVRVRDDLAGGEEIRLDTLRLTIPVSNELILEPHWLAFQIAARREREEFTTYVCTPRDIFRREGGTEVPPIGDAYAFWC